MALGPDEVFVLISETIGYTVKKLWLEGPHAGEVEVIIPELPAMPDNITFDGELFWMAALVERDPILDWVHPRSPALKRLLARLPLRWIPSPVRDSKLSFVAAFDGHGTIVHNLEDHTGRYGGTTSVVRHGGHLYLGSISERAVARINVPPRRISLAEVGAPPRGLPSTRRAAEAWRMLLRVTGRAGFWQALRRRPPSGSEFLTLDREHLRG